MTTALQQQVFSLDARYNANRVPQCPNFRTLYIRRRSQLLRETQRSSDKWMDYIKLRSLILQQKYGKPDSVTTFSNQISTDIKLKNDDSICPVYGTVMPTKDAEASRAMVGGNTIAENYAFVGVQHIFDQHSEAVTTVKFANNDRNRLCCSSLDGNLSICDINDVSPAVTAILRGHTMAISDFDWSLNNDLIVSASLDGSIKIWKVVEFRCLSTIRDPHNAQILCCLFRTCNNNLIVTGNGKGELRMANISTGRFMKNVCNIGGTVLSLTSDTSGFFFWAGNDRGEIVSVFCELNGALNKMNKICLSSNCSITSLSYRAWISREARDPLLLVNATDNYMYLLSVTDFEGSLQLKRKFHNRHQKHIIRSTFCPIMSFRQGACVESHSIDTIQEPKWPTQYNYVNRSTYLLKHGLVTGSEDGNIYFVDIERMGPRSIVNTLQGHASTVLSISFNYDESFLATSDIQGLVIIWKRENSSV